MAAFTFTRTDTLYLSPPGGAQIMLFGTWPVAAPIQVYIGPLGTALDSACYSGKPGQATTLYALQSSVLVAFAPQLASNLSQAHMYVVCGSNTQLYSNQFQVRPQQFYSSVYSLRSVLPPIWSAGSRNIAVETAPQ